MDDQNNPQTQASVPPTPPEAPVSPIVVQPIPAAAPAVTPAPGQAPVAFGSGPAPVAASVGAATGSNGSGLKNKKGLLVGLIVAGAVVVLGGGSALGYSLYYQNPQKVVTDGVIKAFTAKSVKYTSTIDVSNDDITVNVTLDGAAENKVGQTTAKIAVKTGGKTYKLSATGLVDDKTDIYFKVGDIKDLAKDLNSMMPLGSQSAIDDIVSKIDNQWIKVTADDLRDVSEEASKAQTCATDAIKKFQDDKKATKEIGTLYRKNQFIVIDEKLGSKDGNLGYTLKADGDKLKAFSLSLKETTVYKDLHDCDSSFEINESDFDDIVGKATNDSDRFELWVDRWSHQIAEVNITSKADDGTKLSATFKPVFNKSVKIEAPAGATTIKELTKDIEALSEKYSGSTYNDNQDYNFDDTDYNFDDYDY